MHDLESMAQKLAGDIHLKLIELASLADENEKVLFVNIQGDYMCPTGNVGSNIITECEITVEDI